ncbi:MAG: hypothetical protein OXI88_12630 [Gammaproteobacteria bacterium]|nr:hypothetical protein [Gammaproteobacteria bacterium]MDE0512621.1 hypothetical protein [Gammaproteobacteria bacterium]
MVTDITGTSCFIGIICRQQQILIFVFSWLLLTTSPRIQSADRHMADEAAMQDLDVIRQRLENNPLGTCRLAPF